jgi:integrase
MTNKNNKLPLNFLPLFDSMITAMRTGRKRLPGGQIYKPESIKVYTYVRNNLQLFTTETGFELRLKNVKHLSKRQLVQERNYWKKFHRRFTDYMHTTRGLNDNYVCTHMKAIRAFLNYVKNELLIDIGNFKHLLHARREEIPVIVLTPEQLHYLIYNTEFETGLPGRLKKAKDIFVLGCTIALRYSDLMNLTKANLLNTDSKYYLAVRSKKTKTFTQVRLPDYAVEIFKKYRKTQRTLIPTISKHNLNKYLKELTEKAGWTEPLAKYREQRGKPKEVKLNGKKYRFCDHISSHTMRRTAITTMLTLGVPEHIVRSISGHSPMSKEFFRYVAIAQIYKDREIDKMHERLKMVG